MFYEHLPTRKVHWRWQLARAAAAGQPIHDADVWVQRAIRHLEAAAQPGSDRPELECPIAAAVTLWAATVPYTRWAIEAYALAGVPIEEIAAKVELAPAVVEAYEKLFFDVRDHLAATDWIEHQAIRLDAVRETPSETLGALWRSHGYRGGRIVVDAFIAASLGQPLPEAYLAEFGRRARLLDLCFRMKVNLSMSLMHVRDRKQLGTLRRMHQKITAYEQQLTSTPKTMDENLARAIEAMAEKIIPHQLHAALA